MSFLTNMTVPQKIAFWAAIVTFGIIGLGFLVIPALMP